VTRDGFTGHEHLDNVGLVHMNGRVYDPAIARFLSPDPVVTSPFNRQDLNRYSYAWNSPLSVVDPTGLEEVTCLHGPHGRCAGVTVTGLRDRSPGGSAYYAWRTGSNGQAVSAAQRDPCGQDGSAAACSRGYREQAGGGGDAGLSTHGPGTTTDYWQGFAAQVGNLGMNSVPVFWLFGVDQGYTWFPIPDSQAGSRGARLGSIGYFAGGFAGMVRGAATRTLSSTGGVVRRFELSEDQIFYRTFSGDARVGSWLTTTRPRSQSWAQEALALPPWNKATHVQEVRVPRGTLVERSRASRMPEWGRTRGGAEQYKLLETIPESSFGPGSPLP
jgi:RHS repeat-associated protein